MPSRAPTARWPSAGSAVVLTLLLPDADGPSVQARCGSQRRKTERAQAQRAVTSQRRGHSPHVHHAVGRVVRWDAHAGTGAVVVDLPAEVAFDADAVHAPG